MPRIRYDHIDLRVNDLARAAPFYRALLPLLGFERDQRIENWIQYETRSPGVAEAFFGVAEDPAHIPNANRIAFGADSRAEVDRLAEKLRALGARNIEGPACEDSGYYAVYFEDPFGNRFEICHRS